MVEMIKFVSVVGIMVNQSVLKVSRSLSKVSKVVNSSLKWRRKLKWYHYVSLKPV
jgi:hypothetical protein